MIYAPDTTTLFDRKFAAGRLIADLDHDGTVRLLLYPHGKNFAPSVIELPCGVARALGPVLTVAEAPMIAPPVLVAFPDRVPDGAA